MPRARSVFFRMGGLTRAEARVHQIGCLERATLKPVELLGLDALEAPG